MLTPKQFQAFAPRRKLEIRSAYFYIPRNKHGIRSGYYRDMDITRLLQENFGKPKAIMYIARQVAQR
jgi:hypothetical protein